MTRLPVKKIALLLGLLAVLWVLVQWVLPLAVPFLIGTALALAAEPAVRFAAEKWKLPRVLGAGVFVTGTLLLLLSLLVIFGSLLLRQLGRLTDAMPDLEQTARQGLGSLEEFLLSLAYRAPEGIRPLLTKTVLGFFGSGNQLVQQLAQRIPVMATSLLSHVPDGALTLFTAVLSAFMLSARLPVLERWLRRLLYEGPLAGFSKSFSQVRRALTGWLQAQLKLSCVSFSLLLVGFLLMGIAYAPVWALVVAIVDAVPLLGTGTMLVPWALACFVQGSYMRGIGLLGIFAVAALTRSALEPRLVGKQLGLDPLMTLAALYAGFKLWGIGGMLLAPVLSVTVKELLGAGDEPLLG